MITILRDCYNPDQAVKVDYEGRLIDYLTEAFPHGFGSHKHVIFINQELVQVADYDVKVKANDNVVIITTVPEGLETATILFLVSIAVNILFAALSYILAPKNKAQTKGSRTYDINSGQNVPALGQPIAEHFGTCWFYPDVASQPYTFYANNEQYLHEILLLGAGEYRINGIRFGDTDIETIPDGIVEYRLFLPSEVKNRYGYIYSQFGVQEDVITSSDVQGIELQRNANSSWFGKRQGSEQKIKGTVTPERFSVGETVQVLINVDNNYGVSGSLHTISAISGLTVFFTDLVGRDDKDSWLQIVKPAEDDGWRGWFNASIIGKQVDIISLDFAFLNGLNASDTEGTVYAFGADLVIEIQQIDDLGVNIGAVITKLEFPYKLSKNTYRVTYSYPVTRGRYKVRVKKATQDDALSRFISACTWQGLKAYCYNVPDSYSYGDVSLLAVKIKASSKLSSTSDKISVNATRILPTIASDFTVMEPTNNPIDAFCKIVRDIDINGLDVPSLKVLATKWANTNGFNYRFTETDVAYTALQTIAYSHRSTPEAYAYKLSMRQDVPKSFDQFIISNEHMIKDTYKTGIKLAEQIGNVDGFRIGYQDPTGVRQLFAVYPSGSINPSEQILLGCTDLNTALQQGAYLFSKFQTQGRVVEFDTEWDALAFNIGDRISVVNSVIDRVQTARVISQAGNVITVDAMLDASYLQVKFRDELGQPTEILNAGMYHNQLTVYDPIPITLYGINSGQENTAVMLATLKDYSRSYIVSTLTPNDQTVTVTAASYSDEPYAYPIPNELP